MGPLICTSCQHGGQLQETWSGTDVEKVEENILTGDKQRFENVCPFFSPASQWWWSGLCCARLHVCLRCVPAHLEVIRWRKFAFVTCIACVFRFFFFEWAFYGFIGIKHFCVPHIEVSRRIGPKMLTDSKNPKINWTFWKKKTKTKGCHDRKQNLQKHMRVRHDRRLPQSPFWFWKSKKKDKIRTMADVLH